MTIATINAIVERYAVGFVDSQRHTNLTQMMSVIFVVTYFCQLRICRLTNVGEKICGVIHNGRLWYMKLGFDIAEELVDNFVKHSVIYTSKEIVKQSWISLFQGC